MNDRASHARQWLAKAESDLLAARRLLDAKGPYDAACFHAQQAAEKALKALLAHADVPILYTHNLEDLQAHCLKTAAAVCPDGLSGLSLTELTPFAVESRYDVEFWPSESVAADALVTAERVCSLVRKAMPAS